MKKLTHFGLFFIAAALVIGASIALTPSSILPLDNYAYMAGLFSGPLLTPLIIVGFASLFSRKFSPHILWIALCLFSFMSMLNAFHKRVDLAQIEATQMKEGCIQAAKDRGTYSKEMRDYCVKFSREFENCRKDADGKTCLNKLANHMEESIDKAA